MATSGRYASLKRIAKMQIAIIVIVVRIFIPMNRLIIVLPVMVRIKEMNAAIPRQIRTTVNKIEYACSIILFFNPFQKLNKVAGFKIFCK